VDDLRSADYKAVLEFVEDAWAASGERPFTAATIEALDRLVPSDRVGYTDVDRVARRVHEYVGNDGDDGGVEEFWAIVEDHPICRHQQAYADFSATRLSDVISPRRLVHSPIYAVWFRKYDLAAELEIGIGTRARTRNFVLDRADGDYSRRDRAVLELVRPHLARIHEQTALRAQAGTTTLEDAHGLTTRETEILELVACGLTNAAIAERLWISPGTVKKHLDNIYTKLGVRTRTAAARALDRPV
jgi:DNA-binding CsgD family transcriptional regulator